MDQIPLVEHVIQDGQKLVDRLIQEGFPVIAAGWIKVSESSQWHLYIISPVVENEGRNKGYRRVHAVVRQMQAEDSWIEPLDVKLMDPTDPVAEALTKMQRRPASHIPLRFGGVVLGGLSIDGAFIYPPIAAPTK